jgi:hypothetical protein
VSASSIPEPIVVRHFPLAAVLWPDSGALRAVTLIALGTALLTLSAKINLPLPYVPMTLQTLVVLVIGAAYGGRLGAATIMVWVAGVCRSGRRSCAVDGADGRLSHRLCGRGLYDGMAERAWLGPLGGAVVCGDGNRARHHSRMWICLACVRHEARCREGMACRDRALCRSVRDKKRVGRSPCTSDQACAGSPRLNHRRPAVMPLTPLPQLILAAGSERSSAQRRTDPRNSDGG